jgi:superfamily II DNA or RNA helicase
VSDDAANLAAARDRIATFARAGLGDVGERLGTLTLRPHQTSAVARLNEIIARHRGALLADGVGLGKTYVALAIARQHNTPLVICPANLRPMWRRAMEAAGLSLPVISIDSLSRGDRPGFEPDLIILDEAHHLRTPTTRRYAALANLGHRAHMLLLSATPLHNRRRDLTAVLALFLGSAVHTWSDPELARLIVRRDENMTDQRLPPVIGPQALSPGEDDDCLDAICTIPPAVPAADEGTAAALAVISTVHLWASSRAALLASLRKRRARAIALRDAIASGHLPTSGELSTWHYADESLQLAFPFCVSAESPDVDITKIRRQLDIYIAAVTRLIATCRADPNPDDRRAGLLRAIRVDHPGQRIVAFSQYAETVIGLGRILHTDPGVAIATANGARIASGLISREEVLAQFAGGAPAAPVTERVDLLLSTDVLSEGVDLRGASIVVHLDLPWNPARLEQRVGRTRRIGSTHSAIHVYTFVPPAAAERMLTLERRLAAKVGIADGIVGAFSHSAMPARPIGSDRPQSPVAAGERLRATLRSWIDPDARRNESETIVAAATARRTGWVAVVHVDGLARLVHCVGAQVIEDPTGFLELLAGIDGARPVDSARLSTALAQLEHWTASRSIGADIGIGGVPAAKRAVLDRLSQTVSRAPRHRRTAVLAAAQRVRAGVARSSGVGAERLLDEIAKSVSDDEAWIRSVETCCIVNAGSLNSPHTGVGIRALILLSPHPGPEGARQSASRSRTFSETAP